MVSQGGRLIRRFIRFITFIDLPIKKKFFLFSVGVLFWFLAMTTVATVALVTINCKYSRIVNQTLPHERVVQTISRNLRLLKISGVTLCEREVVDEVNHQGELARRYLEEIRAAISSLALGGDLGSCLESSANADGEGASFCGMEDPTGITYLRQMSVVVEEIAKGSESLYALKVDSLEHHRGSREDLDRVHLQLRRALEQAEELSASYSAQSLSLYQSDTGQIAEIIRLTAYSMATVFLVAVLLLVIFTRWISESIAKPVRAIIRQIHSLGTGDVDLTNKIAITSKDEIGTLSGEFNTLMETVYGMTMFKNVIEEDSTLQDIYGRLGEAFEREAKCRDYVIYEVKENHRDMIVVNPLGVAADDLSCYADILSQCDLCRAKKTGHLISSLAFPGVCKQFKGENGEQHVCIPMNVGGRIGGVVQFLFYPDADGSCDNHEVNSRIFKAEAYIKQSLSVIEAKRLMNALRESALKDPLTGLYNRRFLQEHAQLIISGVLRRQKNVGLLMCDLDYFKQVNDKYGHDTGDIVLRDTAHLIRSALREADFVIRFGGEEFLVLLVDINEGEALEVAEKIRETVAAAKIKIPGGAISKTVSLGVSEFPKDTEAFWQAIKYADVALYRAKEEGRNRSLRFTPEMWSGNEF
ncbi:MAG: hypothetical protein C0621_06705 [Desulfuromonas sp.]|nr:MAG: hypothetical protein C0621_06705 [Desulfuromonas sp.]